MLQIKQFKDLLTAADYAEVAAKVSDGDLAAAESQGNLSAKIKEALLDAAEDGKMDVPPTSPAHPQHPDHKKNEKTSKAVEKDKTANKSEVLPGDEDKE